MATHYVCKRGYWEEYESYRDERGRPRKRFVRYWGKRDPRRNWGGIGPDYGVDWTKIAAEEIVRLNAEQWAYEMFLELQGLVFKEETGLNLPGSPQAQRAQEERAQREEWGKQIDAEVAQSLQAEEKGPANVADSEPGRSEESEQPSELAADTTDTSTPSSPDATPDKI